MFGCTGIKNELDQLGIKNSGVGPDFPVNNLDGLVPDVELSDSIKAVIVGYDNLISLPKLVKVIYSSCLSYLLRSILMRIRDDG